MDDDRRQTARVWEADLGEAGRRLTLEELRALETMHHCHLLGRAVAALEDAVRQLGSLEGRFDRLERFLVRLDPERYPRQPAPERTPLPTGGAEGM